MSDLAVSLGIDKLTPDERLRLAWELYDLTLIHGPPPPTEEWRAELRRRVAESEADPDGGVPAFDALRASMDRVRAEHAARRAAGGTP